MTRIIAGSARGRPLVVPKTGTRPTSDRVKESLFSMLEHSLNGFHGLRVLDLFAGSGGLGLESASRGASHVVLVDQASSAIRAIEQNIATTKLPGCHAVAANVSEWVRTAPSTPGWDVVFADPPYDMDDSRLAAIMADLALRDALSPNCHVLVERAKPRGANSEFPWPEGFSALPPRTYGDTVVHHAVCYVPSEPG